jgi:hypothetical protein
MAPNGVPLVSRVVSATTIPKATKPHEREEGAGKRAVHVQGGARRLRVLGHQLRVGSRGQQGEHAGEQERRPDRPAHLGPISPTRAYTTGQFKRAWRRLTLILRGGEVASINRKLRRLKMPRVRTGRKVLPKAPVALAWVPLSLGNPETAKNHPRHWWPGARYVDWVGSTWYSRYRRSAVFHGFYSNRIWRRKPFMFAEWGVWGAESPSFVRQFFGFLKSHRRVRMAVYYQSGSLKPEFRLSTHPRSRAALRSAVRWSRLTGLAPEFR